MRQRGTLVEDELGLRSCGVDPGEILRDIKTLFDKLPDEQVTVVLEWAMRRASRPVRSPPAPSLFTFPANSLTDHPHR
jgi:hypothetical protein